MLAKITLAALLLALAAAGGSKTKCYSDDDCPSSYCMKDTTKKPPYTCHDCGPNCCNSDDDCPGSYCMKDMTKKPPFSCHGGKATDLWAKVMGRVTGKAAAMHCEVDKKSAPITLKLSNDNANPVKVRACNKYDPVSGAPCVGNIKKPNHYNDCPAPIAGKATNTVTVDADTQYIAFTIGSDEIAELWKPKSGKWPSAYTIKSTKKASPVLAAQAAPPAFVTASKKGGCMTDADCPSSYCQTKVGQKGPFACHTCGDLCCLKDADCDTGYCQNDSTKTPPYFCHPSAAEATEAEAVAPKKDDKFHQVAGNLCYETTYNDDHYTSLGYKTGACPSKFNTELAKTRSVVCDGHSEQNVKTCPGHTKTIYVVKKGITSDVSTVKAETLSFWGPDKFHQVAGNLCYETTYNDDHYTNLGYKTGACPSKFNTELAKTKSVVCDGHSEQNVKTCPGHTKTIYVVKKGITSDLQAKLAMAATAKEPKYHQVAGNLCYEVRYHDAHFESQHYVKGACPSKFNTKLARTKSVICDGHSEQNIKTCPGHTRTIFVVKKGITQVVLTEFA